MLWWNSLQCVNAENKHQNHPKSKRKPEKQTRKRIVVPKEESNKRPNNSTFNVQLSNVVWQILREPDSLTQYFGPKWTKCVNHFAHHISWLQNLGLSMLSGKERYNGTTQCEEHLQKSQGVYPQLLFLRKFDPVLFFSRMRSEGFSFTLGVRG